MEQQKAIINMKYQILFNEAPMPILLLDQEGAVKEVNPEATVLFESSASELMAKPIRNLVVPVSRSGRTGLWQTDDQGMPLLCGVFDVPLGGRRKRVKVKSKTVESGDTRDQFVMILEVAQTASKDKKSDDYRIDGEIRRGLVNGEFLLHFQPQADIRTGDIVGAEALIRWSNAGKGLIPPERFIPLAEQTGAILDIGYWVLETGCRQLHNWMEQGLPPVRLSVNLSASQFMDPLFTDRLKDVLKETGADPRYLCLEITENTAVKPEIATTRLCREISELGVRLAIDDFGMEYSSLSLLKRLDVDMIKIDRSFVKDMLHDKQDLAIVNAIIALSHGLGKRVIAEGVEEELQWRSLEKLGCDEIQGFFISKPVEAGQFAQLLARGRPL